MAIVTKLMWNIQKTAFTVENFRDAKLNRISSHIVTDYEVTFPSDITRATVFTKGKWCDDIGPLK